MSAINDSVLLGRPVSGTIKPELSGVLAAPVVIANAARGTLGTITNLSPITAGAISSPNSVDSEAPVALSTANVLAPNVSSFAQAPEGATRILWDDLIPQASTVNAVNMSGVADSVKTNQTFERLTSDSAGATVTIVLPANANMDTIGVACVSDDDVTIAITDSDDSSPTFTAVATANAPKGSAMAFFGETSVRQIRVTFAASGGVVARVMGGIALRMQRKVYVGHTPSPFANQTEFRNAVSNTGEFIGRDIVRRGYQEEFSFSNLQPDWIRSTFAPFINHAERFPFFIAWKPDQYADESLYGWSSDNIRPINERSNGFMGVEFTVQGYNKR